jgi:hypothetical protein
MAGRRGEGGAAPKLTIRIVVPRSGRLGRHLMAEAQAARANLVTIRTSVIKYRVISMRLDMLFEVLRPLERLAAKLTLVRLEGHMDADVGRDVVPLDRCRPAAVPLASQAKIVGALAANVTVTNVVVEALGIGKGVCAVQPFAF